MTESLLILDAGHSIADVEAVAPIRQRYGNRVLVVGTADTAALARLGRVVAAGEAAPEPGPEFDETEQMGIHAWNARPELATKQRPGEGLAWDTPGFEPP